MAILVLAWLLDIYAWRKAISAQAS